MAHRKDTHDIGFIVEPALRRDYELTGNEQSLRSILTAAESLATRYNDKTRAIRSWDRFINNRHHYTDRDSGFLVIIDSMCSKCSLVNLYSVNTGLSLTAVGIDLDLLYYAGHHFSSQRLIDIATTHAHTVRKTHLREVTPSKGSKRPQYATCHVANLCPETGEIRQRLTAQGFSDSSTWARGQAWAIMGYAQTYSWTKDPVFLETACGLAEHFIDRMETAPQCVEIEQADGGKTGRYVPLWDFDAPIDEKNPLRDSSAGVIAANGMLLMYSAMMASGNSTDGLRFFQYAMKIVKDTLELCYATDELKLVLRGTANGDVEAVAESANASVPSFDAILMKATANFNENWTDKYYDHGLVYGDYYLLEFGNRLLQMGIY